MNFILEDVPNNDVKLTLSDGGNGRIYLRANSILLMGFRDGRFCRYTDSHACKITGLVYDAKNIIRESTFIFSC